MDLPNDSSRNDLGRGNQSSTSVSPVSPVLSNGDLEPTRGDLHSEGEGTSHLDLLNTDDGALPRRESMEGALATDDNASRRCHTSPDFELL